MAFPEDIGSAVGTHDLNTGFVGPYKSSGGDFYSLAFADTSTIGMFKSTDPGTAAWSEQDSGNNITVDVGIHGMDSVQDGDTIHVAYASAVAAYRYNSFSMSSDTWGTDELIVNPTDTGFLKDKLSINIARRSDGDLVVLYNGTYENVHGTRFARVHYGIKVSSWSVDTVVSGAGEEDWFGSMIVPGSSDRMHFFFNNRPQADAYQRTLRSDDNMETLPSSFDTSVASTRAHHFVKGMSYDDGGTQKVRAPYEDVGGKMSVAEMDSVDTPSISVNTDVSDFGVSNNGNLGVAGFMLADGTDEHLLYVKAGVVPITGSVWRDLNDDTDIEEVVDPAEGRIQGVSGNVYEHGSSKVLAFIYSDDDITSSTAARYYEFELAALDTTAVKDVLHSIGIIPFAR